MFIYILLGRTNPGQMCTCVVRANRPIPSDHGNVFNSLFIEMLSDNYHFAIINMRQATCLKDEVQNFNRTR